MLHYVQQPGVSFNANGVSTYGRYDYGRTTNYGLASPWVFAGVGVVSVPFPAGLSNLPYGVSFHYRLVLSNALGIAYGPDQLASGPFFPPGDADFNGVVDGAELGTVLSNYWPQSGWLEITNAYGNPGAQMTMLVDAPAAERFSVEYTTNFTTWTRLTNTTPAQVFTDPSGSTQRFYRLRWP